MLARNTFRLLLTLALLPGALSACQVIAGIEDRKLDPAASGSGKLCSDYCDAVMDACKDDDAVYPNRDQCMGVCTKLPPGDTEERANVNSVACRLRFALSAKREASDCKYAGPGGNNKCGTDCEAYCTIYPKSCPDDFQYGDEETCLQACAGLKEQPDRYNLTDDHEGDTIECRLVHTSSSTVSPAEHCPHATIFPAAPWCIANAKTEPTCDEYCKIEMAACQGSLAQYEDDDQCQAACAALPIGTNGDTTMNTVGCRRYHSFNSTLLPETHCSHAGPSGDGHCGSNCDAYCTLAAKACPAQFAAAFASAAACADDCATLPESKSDSVYSVESAQNSSGFQCRMLHAVQALTDATQCGSALGGDDCQ